MSRSIKKSVGTIDREMLLSSVILGACLFSLVTAYIVDPGPMVKATEGKLFQGFHSTLMCYSCGVSS